MAWALLPYDLGPMAWAIQAEPTTAQAPLPEQSWTCPLSNPKHQASLDNHPDQAMPLSSGHEDQLVAVA